MGQVQFFLRSPQQVEGLVGNWRATVRLAVPVEVLEEQLSQELEVLGLPQKVTLVEIVALLAYFLLAVVEVLEA